MLDALTRLLPSADALFMVAAVADYKVKEVSDTKLKKADGLPEIILEENPDILKELMKIKKDHQAIIGFSVESQDAIAEGSRKLKEKDLDYIVVNSTEAFGSQEAKVVILGQGQQEELSASKSQIAENLVAKLAKLLKQKTIAAV